MKGDGASAKALGEEELGITEDEISTLNYDEATVSPRVKQMAGLIKFWWDAEQVQAEVSRIHQHKDGRTTCELKIMTTAPGYRNHLHQSQINLVATRSKQELAKHLEGRRNDVDWQILIEELATEVLNRVRQGEPVVCLSTEDHVTAPTYLLEPLLPRDQPTIIYGLGGTGKSMLALLIAMSIRLPWHDNPLRWRASDQALGVMYLDWETSQDEIAWRMKCLQLGMSMPMVEIDYRRCAMPLADDTEAIHRAILDRNIGFVVVDSLGAACGGDLNAAEPAIRMFTALRELKLTSLLVAHTSKNPSTKQTSVYGTGFFEFYARSIWEMKKVQEAGDDFIKVGLYHRKVNRSKLHQPVGFTMSFQTDSTRFESLNVGKVTELAQHLSIAVRIINELGSNGKRTPQELADTILAPVETVRAKLHDLKRRAKVVQLGLHEWALAYDEKT